MKLMWVILAKPGSANVTLSSAASLIGGKPSARTFLRSVIGYRASPRPPARLTLSLTSPQTPSGSNSVQRAFERETGRVVGRLSRPRERADSFAMEIVDVLPPRFGFVILTFCYSWVMLTYLAVKVGSARKKYGVKYPTMYSDKEQVFNCIQRAHQNTLEVYPQWLVFQTIAALVYPTAASVLGVIWVTSRFSYAWGYYTGDPAKRMNGAYGYIGIFGVMILSIAVALQLLGLF